jgi:hypothetical protein
MTSTFRILQIIWGSLISAIVLYLCVGEMVPHPNPGGSAIMFEILAGMAVITVGVIFVLRQLTAKLLAGLEAQPENAASIARWRGLYIISIALCEVIAMYGFVLRMLGFSLMQVGPFYIAGMALLLLFAPKRVDLLDMTTR